MGIFNPFNGTFNSPALLVAGSNASPSLAFAQDPGTGWYRNNSLQWTWSGNGTNDLTLTGNLIRINGTLPLTWGSGDSTSVSDTGLSRTAAGVIAIGNSAQGDASGKANCAAYQVAGTQVVSSRITGYGTPTGNVNQGSFAAGSITLPNLAAGVAQLILDLKTHGLLGT